MSLSVCDKLILRNALQIIKKANIVGHGWIMVNVIEDVLYEELDRVSRNLEIYTKKLNSFPKGALVKKIRKNHIAYYLVYRSDGKVVTDYVRKGDIDDVEEKVKKRDILLRQIKELRIREKSLKKLLKKKVQKDGR